VILQRYIFRELVFSFLFTFGVVMGVFLVGMSFQVFRAYSSIGMGTLIRIIPLAATSAASWAVLLAVPPSVTLVYGRLSADNEVDAMRISGIATRRMVTPALIFALFVCAGAYMIIEVAAPTANYARRMLIREFSIELLKAPPPGKQHFPFGTFELSYLDCTEGVMRMPYLTQYVDGLPQTEYTALSGRALVDENRQVRFMMNRWTAIHHEPSGRVTFASAENEYAVELPLEDFFKAEKRPENLRGKKLWQTILNEPPGRRRNWMLTGFYSRFAQSLAPLLLVLAAVPIGILVRRGSRLAGLGAALPPLLVYMVSFFIFQGMGENGRMPPAAAAFAPDAVLFLLGSSLLWGVCRR